MTLSYLQAFLVPHFHSLHAAADVNFSHFSHKLSNANFLPLHFSCRTEAGPSREHWEHRRDCLSLQFCSGKQATQRRCCRENNNLCTAGWLSPPQPQTFWLIETLPAKLHQVFAECRPPQRIFITPTLNTPSCSRTGSTREAYGAKHTITILQNFSATFAVTAGTQFVVTREVWSSLK